MDRTERRELGQQGQVMLLQQSRHLKENRSDGYKKQEIEGDNKKELKDFFISYLEYFINPCFSSIWLGF